MKIKKILSLILSLAMILGTLGTVAFADDAAVHDEVLSSVTATEIKENNLTYAVKFSGNEMVTGYTNWKMNVELTVNKNITLEYDNSAADGHLSVLLPDYPICNVWRDIPQGSLFGGPKMPAIEIKANEPVKVLDYYMEDIFGKNNTTAGYEDIFGTHNNMACGIHLTDEFLTADENKDFYGELSLKIYELGYGSEVKNTLTLATYKFGDVAVAKVGNTKYGTIDEAIANWTNGTTLTLLDNVELSDVITLNSTEHHILNLGTYTMTAASGKNVFEIKACGTGDAERNCITIKADKDNPGTLDAGKKAIVYYNYGNGGISGTDRPIIKIEGGIFNAATNSFVFGTNVAGITTIGSEARKCATLDISGGTFNCSILGNTKSKLLISGGTFNYSVGSQGDSTALRLISGGTFKTFGFMTADDNNTKFWIGSAMAKSDVGVYIDDNGYLVVGGDVITENDGRFEAVLSDYSKWNSCLKYSSAAANGLYFTSAEKAFEKLNKKGSIKLFTDYAAEIKTSGNLAIDLTDDDAFFGGAITLSGKDYTLTVTTDDESKLNAVVYPASGCVLVTEKSEDENGIKTITYKNSTDETLAVAKAEEYKYETLQMAIDSTDEGDTVTLLKDTNESVIFKAPAAQTFALTVPSGVTLDLDGFELTGSVVVEEGAAATLTNGTIGGVITNSGTLSLTDIAVNGDIVSDKGDIVINSGEFTGNLSETNGEIVINGGLFTDDVAEFAADDKEVVYRGDFGFPYTIEPKATQTIEVKLEKVNDNLYNINLYSDGNYSINEFVAAELVFENKSTTHSGALMNYEVLGSVANSTVAQKAIVDGREQYIINLTDGEKRLSGHSFTIGQVKFIGQGTIDFSILNGEIDTTSMNTNLGRYYSTANNKLILDDDAKIDSTVSEITRNVAINVAYNHPLVKNVWSDDKITVTLKDYFGKEVTDDITDGIATFANVSLGRITVTLEAPGFRKFVYNTTLDADDAETIVLNFWNDVKVDSKKEAIEAGTEKVAYNFVVGDIVMDYIVDKYDLAAVTSYYGMYNIANNSKYLMYDLNRDGNIDIRDVQYVLHTMGN